MMKGRRKHQLKCFEVPILGGKFKGKKILIPDISTTRSSKSILRESLFNTLQFEIIGKNFVEVFAGSGSVGLEALSRGAAKVFFIELNSGVYDVLNANISSLGSVDAAAIRGDSFEEFPPLLRSVTSHDTPTYFYFDPPFSTRDGMEDIYSKTLELIESIPASICEMVIVEHMSKMELPETIGTYGLLKKKKFGKSSLSYYTKD